GRVPVDEHTTDDHVLLGLVLGDDAGGDRVDDGAGDGRLGRAEHLDGLLGPLDGHLGDHDRGRLANDVRADDGQETGVPGRLVGPGVGERGPDGAVLVADQEVDVGDFVAVADQGFTDEHGHGETPWVSGFGPVRVGRGTRYQPGGGGANDFR